MATSPKPSLDPASGDDRGASLSALELGASGGIEFVEVGRTEVGQRVTLEPSPEKLHRIEVRRVRRQERNLDVAAGGVQVLAHELAAVRLQAVPD